MIKWHKIFVIVVFDNGQRRSGSVEIAPTATPDNIIGELEKAFPEISHYDYEALRDGNPVTEKGRIYGAKVLKIKTRMPMPTEENN